MIPSGIWRRAKAKLKSDTAPVPTSVASDVTTMNVIWVTPSPIARGAISVSARRAWGSRLIDVRHVAEAELSQRRELDEEMAHRSGDDAERETVHPERRREQQSRPDDREVVDDRGHGRGGEPAARVEDARRHRTERQEDRAEQHDPGQLDGLVELDRPEAGRDRRAPGPGRR